MKGIKLFVFFMSVVALLPSCCRVEKKDDVEIHTDFVLQNDELEQAILEYQKRIFADNERRMAKGDSVYVSVYAKGINDSITRYVLFPVVDSNDLKFNAPFFTCMVGGHYVFFSFRGSRLGYKEKDRILKLKDEVYETQLKNFFPNEYILKSKKNGLHSVYLYEPENCYLTFLYDRLIDKTYKRGADFDKIQISIDGKDVYM